MKNLLEEFKKFINRGSVIELAVAVVVGTAFTKIVNSFVKDILMPLISIVIGDEGFENFKYVITEGDEVAGIAENAIYYGRFIQNSLDFLIVAVVVFAIIKIINKLKEEFDDIVDIVDEFVDDLIDSDDEVKEKASE
ncbi:MAG: Large-conductance mechanosensitive channel [Candidatus Izimaplasma bacterium HR2]|nr:MAG: Large-conductance mechanosensitive channel [Candidatus Izimaplasma bacterium HR2]